MEGTVSHLRSTPSRPRNRPTHLAAALNTPSVLYSVYLASPAGRRRTPLAPSKVSPLRLAHALSPLCIQPSSRAGRRWAQWSVMGAVSSGRIQRPPIGAPGFGHVLHVARVPPKWNSLSPRTPYPVPFSCHSYGCGIACPGTRSTPPIFGNLIPRSPFQPSLLVAIVAPAFPIICPRCPISCPQLDAISASLNVLSSVACRVCPPDLARSWAWSGPEHAAPRVVPVLVVPCSPALPIQAGTEDRHISAAEGSFLPGSAWALPQPRLL